MRNKKPSDKIFNEIKKEAIKLWRTYDNTHGYVDEKVGRVEDIKNIDDNAIYIFAMFDLKNQKILISKLSEESKVYLGKSYFSGLL